MLLCCYASDLVIKYRNFMAQEVTAHSGCEKYPNYHFLRVLSHTSDTVTRLLLVFPTRGRLALELYIICILYRIYYYINTSPLPSIFIFLK